MDQIASAQALRLFNEKAEKLESLSFTSVITKQTTGVMFSGSNTEAGSFMSMERFGPSSESIDAFVLTFRFFIQNNEVSSFRSMVNVYDSGLFSTPLSTEWRDLRADLNRALDSTSFVGYNNQQLTMRRILETFVYGGLSHANVAKKELYAEWKRNPLFFPLVENEFVRTLAFVLDVVSYGRQLNERALRELAGDS